MRTHQSGRVAVVPSSDLDYRWMRRILYPAVFLAAIGLSHCEAQAQTMGLHLYSVHFDRDEEMPDSLAVRDFTPGVYGRLDSGLTFGAVRNSLGRASFYVAQTWETDNKRWAITLGAISGYQYRMVTGPQACVKKQHHNNPAGCWYQYGETNAILRPLIAPSVTFPEAEPYIGAVPRIALLGKAVSFSVEWGL